MTKIWTNRLKKAKAVARKSWLVVDCEIVDYDFPRNEIGQHLNVSPHPVYWPRFRLTCDGFTQFDARVLPSGNLKILYNRHLDSPAYPEDNAFQFAGFRRGQVVKWEKFFKHFIAYVEISNLRVTHHVHWGQADRKITYNPRRNRVTVRVPEWEVLTYQL